MSHETLPEQEQEPIKQNQEPVDGASNDAQEAHDNPIVGELRAALKAAHEERDSLRDQLMRTMADFQNFRKRTESERVTIRQMATEKLATDLLPVLDNFERTVDALVKGSSLESVKGGIQAVERQLRSILESHNVTRIPSHGQPFDPELHEAIGTEHSEEHAEDTVVHEVEPGYKMADKVIRPARVRVAKKK